MAKMAKRKPAANAHVSAAAKFEVQRRRELQRCVREEKQIVKLSRELARRIAVTDLRLAQLAGQIMWRAARLESPGVTAPTNGARPLKPELGTSPGAAAQTPAPVKP